MCDNRKPAELARLRWRRGCSNGPANDANESSLDLQMTASYNVLSSPSLRRVWVQDVEQEVDILVLHSLPQQSLVPSFALAGRAED